MTEQVLGMDDSAGRIVRPKRPEKKNALPQAFSLLATAWPLSAAAPKPAGLVSDVVDAAQVEAAIKAARERLPAGPVALSRMRLRGHSNDVVKRINVETMHFKERLQSDETSAAIAVPSFKI